MIASLFRDKKFISTLIRLASPIVVQELIRSSLGLVDVMMLGQLGDSTVAAVGIANQVFFLASLLFFGVTSGTAIFAAQYWGQKDISRIQAILGLCLSMSVSGALIISLVAILAPEWVLSIFTTDPEVIALGSKYLRVVSFSYAATAITSSYSAVLRSTENVKLPMLVSILSLGLNTFLNYGLIFGNFGLPALGVFGAGIGTAIARVFEVVLLLAVIYYKKSPLATAIANLFNFRLIPLWTYFKTTLPVVITEIIWSLGVTTYNVVFARIGTSAIAAFNISNTIDRLVFVIFVGLGNACAIMIGNRIGAGEHHIAFEHGKKFLFLTSVFSIFLGLLILVITGPLLTQYNVSFETIEFARKILIIKAGTLSFRALNMILLIGILRSGGDTRFAFLIDAGSIWVIGVPLAFFGAFGLGLPIHWVYLMVLTGDLVKMLLGLKRFFSQRWIKRLTTPA